MGRWWGGGSGKFVNRKEEGRWVGRKKRKGSAGGKWVGGGEEEGEIC